ncbi:hypothetical protein AVEN_39803-1 [Araneus ventricosus]|uniref:Uncharacterized protein n=1 Tax=Araneus ventricosus TaxID=182803 RepID=A0A4Y2XD79_ARAVE|nr:hypothetical protein AVEN_39803-1 [Araneus ventricosus]
MLHPSERSPINLVCCYKIIEDSFPVMRFRDGSKSNIQIKPQDDSDLEETDEPENLLASHSEAENALEIELRYIEQSENATSIDIIFMRRWHNIASMSRITALRQTNLTNFFSRKGR